MDTIVTAYLNQGVGPTMTKRAVEAVEYDPSKDPNRTTVRLVPGVSVNAERIELFAGMRARANSARATARISARRRRGR